MPPILERTCTLCSKTKEISEFPVHSTKKGTKYYHGRCRQCRRDQCKEWSKTENGKAVKRRGILKREFNISESDYAMMLEEQNGCCAICKKPETKLHRNGTVCRLAVDHDHSTGAVRSLLCSKCNVGLGSFEDNDVNLIRAAEYLLRHRK